MYKHTVVSTSTFSSFRDIFHLVPNLDSINHIRRNPLKHSNCNGFKLCSLCEEGDTFGVLCVREIVIYKPDKADDQDNKDNPDKTDEPYILYNPDNTDIPYDPAL